MHVIRHNNIFTNQPRFGGFPSRNYSLGSVTLCKNGFALMCVHRDKSNRCLIAMIEDRFVNRMPAPRFAVDSKFVHGALFWREALRRFPILIRRFWREALRRFPV